MTELTGPHPLPGVRWHPAIVVALALAVGAVGSSTLPLDEHETFVVQTAQEMRERGDWLVPYFLGKPRLQKPPLSYWLVAAAADMAGSPRVTPFEGRLPSIVAGAAVVALTMRIATRLVSPSLGLLAGLVAVSSLGIFRYAHHARPDMLYAAWCTAALACFEVAARPSGAPRRRASYGMWACLGLATLTKGPQFPAMVVCAAVAVAWLEGWTLRRLLGVLRPVEGVIVFLAFTAPWWLAVHFALGGEGLRGTQLGGSLLTPSWRGLLDPYYVYRPLELVLPTVVVAAVAVVMRWWPPGTAESTRLLATFVIVPALACSIGPQQRPHYMLPALAPMCVLVALAVGGLVQQSARNPAMGAWTVRGLSMLWGLTLATEMIIAGSRIGWSRERFELADLGGVAGRTVPHTTPLLALDQDVGVPSYYAQRIVRRVRSVDALAQLPPGLTVTILAERAIDAERELVLARVERTPHAS